MTQPRFYSNWSVFYHSREWINPLKGKSTETPFRLMSNASFTSDRVSPPICYSDAWKELWSGIVLNLAPTFLKAEVRQEVQTWQHYEPNK